MDIPINAKTVAVDGTNPAVGDQLEVTVSGKVSKLENGEVYLTVDMVNGEPVADQGGSEMSPEEEESSMRDMISKSEPAY